MKSPQAIVRQPLVNTVIDALRAAIGDGSWPVGERIPTEGELAQLYNVGRNTIREAVRVLSHSGMLEVRQGDGTWVRSALDPAEIMRQVDRSSLRDHFELQCMIESEAAKYAAERRTREDLTAMKRALKQRGEYSPGRDMAEFVALDSRFHQALVDASHNEAMRALYHYFSVSVRHHIEQFLALNLFPEPNLQAHTAVYDAIAARDPQLAQLAVRQMLTPTINYLAQMK